NPAPVVLGVRREIAEDSVGDLRERVEEPGEEVAVEQLPLPVHDAGERFGAELPGDDPDGLVVAPRNAVQVAADRVRGTPWGRESFHARAHDCQLGRGTAREAPPALGAARMPGLDPIRTAHDSARYPQRV